jgi:hypothetical protein
LLVRIQDMQGVKVTKSQRIEPSVSSGITRAERGWAAVRLQALRTAALKGRGRIPMMDGRFGFVKVNP